MLEVRSLRSVGWCAFYPLEEPPAVAAEAGSAPSAALGTAPDPRLNSRDATVQVVSSRGHQQRGATAEPRTHPAGQRAPARSCRIDRMGSAARANRPPGPPVQRKGAQHVQQQGVPGRAPS